MSVGKIANTTCDGRLENAPDGLPPAPDSFSQLRAIDWHLWINLEAQFCSCCGYQAL
jgi:hypothetical protein